MKRLHIKISKEDKSGLYLTVILHVGLVIVLLVSQIATAVNSENTYVLDFSQAEEQERLEQEEEFRQDISDRIDDLLAENTKLEERMWDMIATQLLKDKVNMQKGNQPRHYNCRDIENRV